MNYSFSAKVSGLAPSAIREILKATSSPDVISFAAGNPAPEAFPVDSVAAISADILKNRPIDALQYSITEGYTPLIKTMTDYMSSRYNIGRAFDGMIITSGAQQVMDLATKSLCNEGDTIICENPSFIGSLNAFRSYGANLCGIDMQPDGMDMDMLENALKTQKNVRFIYTIPNFQNPSGITMSLEKRRRMYELAKQYNVLILEDNPYGEIRFEGENIAPIKSMDEDGLVIYAGSFSKVLSPGLRVGYAIAPTPVLAKMTVCKQTSDVHTTIYSQMIADEFMTKYDYQAHLERIRAIYHHKAHLMMDLINEQFAGKITYHPVQGGLFIWCKLPDDVDMLGFCKKCVDKKVAVVPGSAFSANENSESHHFRLNFSTPTDDQLVNGMHILGDIVKTI